MKIAEAKMNKSDYILTSMTHNGPNGPDATLLIMKTGLSTITAEVAIMFMIILKVNK